MERNQLQKTLVEGVEYLDEPTIIVNLEDNEPNGVIEKTIARVTKIIAVIWNVVDLVTPHRNRMKKIKSEFDNSSHSFFEAYRFLNKMSLINLVAYLQLFY